MGEGVFGTAQSRSALIDQMRSAVPQCSVIIQRPVEAMPTDRMPGEPAAEQLAPGDAEQEEAEEAAESTSSRSVGMAVSVCVAMQAAEEEAATGLRVRLKMRILSAWTRLTMTALLIGRTDGQTDRRKHTDRHRSVSYTHLRAHRDRTRSRMPSSA